MFLSSPARQEEFCGPTGGYRGLSRLYQHATCLTVWESSPGGGRDFPHRSRRALRPTQPPVKYVPGLFSEGKLQGRVDHRPRSSTEVKERVERFVYSLSGPS